jgi:predicted N-acetyltransferase YhbS
MPKSIKFEVFGRQVLTIKSEKGWRLFYLSGDGKRRPADDLIVPPEVFMIIGLQPDVLAGKSGIARYHQAFAEL